MFHPRKVKHEKRENSLYIKENNNSLSFFHLFTPAPSRDARPRVYACVREGVVKGETWHGSFAGHAARRPRREQSRA